MRIAQTAYPTYPKTLHQIERRVDQLGAIAAARRDRAILRRKAAKLVRQLESDPALIVDMAYGGEFAPDNWQADLLRIGPHEWARLAILASRQIGKSFTMSLKGAAFLLFLPPYDHRMGRWDGKREKRLLLLIAPSDRQAVNLFNSVREVTENLLDLGLGPEHKSISKTMMTLADRRRVASCLALPGGSSGASSGATLRGFTANMLLLDESSFFPAGADGRTPILSALTPTLAAQQKGNYQLIAASSAGVKSGFFWDIFNPAKEAGTAYYKRQIPWYESERINPEVVKQAEIEDPLTFPMEYMAVFGDLGLHHFFNHDRIDSAVLNIDQWGDQIDELKNLKLQLAEV